MLLSALFLNDQPSLLVLLSLFPIIGGVALASTSELSFTWLGFLSAMGSNLTFQVPRPEAGNRLPGATRKKGGRGAAWPQAHPASHPQPPLPPQSRNVLSKKFMTKGEEGHARNSSKQLTACTVLMAGVQIASPPAGCEQPGTRVCMPCSSVAAGKGSLDNINLFSIITIISFFILTPVALLVEGPVAPALLATPGLWAKALAAAVCFHAYQQASVGGVWRLLMPASAGPDHATISQPRGPTLKQAAPTAALPSPLQVSYMILQRVSPVTHSIGNCVKRVVVIVASVFVFQNPVTRQNALGA